MYKVSHKKCPLAVFSPHRRCLGVLNREWGSLNQNFALKSLLDLFTDMGYPIFTILLYPSFISVKFS